MKKYTHNKIKTAVSMMKLVRNWPTSFQMRLFPHDRGLRLLTFRDGMNVLCRAGTGDWNVIHELFFEQSYSLALDWIGAQKGDIDVLDLGANIGLFSLLAAARNPQAHIIAFEPGPPNIQMFQMNCLANPDLKSRIELEECAMGGAPGTASWFFDSDNPGGSSLYAGKGKTVDVRIAGFAETLATLKNKPIFVKMDIEGSEYDVLRHTPTDALKSVSAYSLELHDDPEGKMSRDEFLDRFKALGFKIKEENVICYFLYRD